MDALLIPTFLCPQAWQSMSGTDKERHCSYCNKSVHNLAAMTARERLALLSSPAATVCSRYKIALRRPVPGRRESYARHLAKYGVGVALAGTTLLVLWEMGERSHQIVPSRYRAVAPADACGGFVPMPDDWYTETEIATLGMVVAMQTVPSPPTSCPPGKPAPAAAVEVRLDPVQLEHLLKAAPLPTNPEFALPLPKKKKAGHRPALGRRT